MKNMSECHVRYAGIAHMWQVNIQQHPLCVHMAQTHKDGLNLTHG